MPQFPSAVPDNAVIPFRLLDGGVEGFYDVIDAPVGQPHFLEAVEHLRLDVV